MHDALCMVYVCVRVCMHACVLCVHTLVACAGVDMHVVRVRCRSLLCIPVFLFYTHTKLRVFLESVPQSQQDSHYTKLGSFQSSLRGGRCCAGWSQSIDMDVGSATLQNDCIMDSERKLAHHHFALADGSLLPRHSEPGTGQI